jgi:hypothetical protein
MNHISIEANGVDTEASQLETLAAQQAQDAITELNAAQLVLVGGGSGIIICD